MAKKINIEHLRQQKLASFCQFILLDKNGFVVESDHIIFDTTNLQSQPVYEWFPFMESMQSTLDFLEKDHQPLLFSKVENPASFLEGVYDFVFEKKEIEGESYLLWEIFDYTSVYEDFRNYQQQRNNLEIQRQRFLLQEKTTELPPQYTAFNKQHVTPNRALDMAINTLLKEISPLFKPDSIIDTLDEISHHIQNIINELPEAETDKNAQESGQERKFSLENILYDSITYAAQRENISIVEASISEELPSHLYGSPLDFKRVLVGLIMSSAKLYHHGTLSLALYTEKLTCNKCTVGIRMKVNAGETKAIDRMDLLLRFSVIRKIVELHQGKIIMESNTSDGVQTVCLLPFLVV